MHETSSASSTDHQITALPQESHGAAERQTRKAREAEREFKRVLRVIYQTEWLSDEVKAGA